MMSVPFWKDKGICLRHHFCMFHNFVAPHRPGTIRKLFFCPCLHALHMKVIAGYIAVFDGYYLTNGNITPFSELCTPLNLGNKYA